MEPDCLKNIKLFEENETYACFRVLLDHDHLCKFRVEYHNSFTQRQKRFGVQMRRYLFDESVMNVVIDQDTDAEKS